MAVLSKTLYSFGLSIGKTYDMRFFKAALDMLCLGIDPEFRFRSGSGRFYCRKRNSVTVSDLCANAVPIPFPFPSFYLSVQKSNNYLYVIIYFLVPIPNSSNF